MSSDKSPPALPFVVATLIVLGGLFVALRPDSETSSASRPPPMSKTNEPRTEKVVLSDSATSNPAATSREPATNAHSFDLRIEGNRLVSATHLIKVSEGDEITLNVTASQAEEFHLHGYDLLLKLTPGETATLRFTADRAGRFEFELERAHIKLGAIEVYPR